MVAILICTLCLPARMSVPRRSRALSAVENGEIGLTQASRVRDHLDGGDLVTCEPEGEDQEQLSRGAMTSPTVPWSRAGGVNPARADEAGAHLATA